MLRKAECWLICSVGCRLNSLHSYGMALASIQSPDGRYSVEQHDDYGEIGMGSPSFGHITIHGTDLEFADHLFGVAVVFSPDSRFVALEKLVGTRPFRTELIVVELARNKLFIVKVQAQGTVTPKKWDGPQKLIYRSWAIGSPTEMMTWEAPLVVEKKKPYWWFWKR